ncbi:hypothetical protein ACFQ7Z_22080 [Streptomyces virginiae]|uniref:hypothetical protein n=1 Tax=Streptomyces virginiae TaxID=1961 RepID=UPI0036BD8D84
MGHRRDELAAVAFAGLGLEPDAPRIQQVRARAERFDGDWDAPTSRAVQRRVDEAFAAAFGPQPQQAAPEAEVLPDVSRVEGLEATEVA